MVRGEAVMGVAQKFPGELKSRKAGLSTLLAVVMAAGAGILSGCAGLASTSNSNLTPDDVQITPASLSFPNVSVGSTATQLATVTNTGSQPVSITQLSLSSSEFSTSGVAMPLTLAPGQSAQFKVAFKSSTAGTVSGTLSAMTSRGGGSTKVKLNGNSGKNASQLSLSTTSLKFGNVLVHGTSTQAVTLKNSGNSDLKISQLAVSGAGFSASGVAVPVTLPAGQSMALQATFAPTTSGSATGSVTITSDAQTPNSSVALSGTGMNATYTMSLTPGSVGFGNLNVGSSSTQTVQLANTGNSSVTVSQITASGAGVSVSGLAAPVTIAPSQSVPVTVKFAPTTAGAVAGSITVTNSEGINVVAAVTGTGVQAGISVTPTSASFGSVVTGNTKSQAIQLKNSGTANLTVSQVAATGSGFSVSGVTLPLTLIPGASSAFNVQYAPTAAGAANGSVTIVSNAPNSPSTVSLSGTGAAATNTLSLNPGSLSFGNLNVGSTASQTVQLANTGNSSVTVSQITASGAGVSVSGLAAPVSIAPSQSVPVTVKFAPTTAGAVAGSITVTNSEGINVVAAVTGTGVQAGISVTPTSASFGSVVTGNTNSQTIQLKNSGTASLTVSQVAATGSGFSVSGVTLPLTLAPGASSNFNAQYAPTAAGAANGSVTIVSNAPNSPSTVSLSGTGTAATYTLSVNPSSLSFGSVNNGSTASQSFNVTNTGNSNVSISGMSATGSGFSITSGGSAVTLSPKQSTSVSVQFAPKTAGSANGSVTLTSNASSPSAVSLSGTGVAPQVNHTVALNWGASPASVAGYNIYRSSVSGSSYAKVNSSLVGGVSFTDSNVQSGQTYYYVATAVDSSGNESVYSNEVPATVP
jgi:Abnormal spindle-like microcephaly-assoc'd, ASPM-SPD-2-Hydin/Transmembrane protein 131-like N-terminal